MARYGWKLSAVIVVSMLILPGVALADVGAAATLSVLSAPVVRVAANTGASGPGTNGMNLAEGDRITTASGGVALITFLNGSTVTVLPGSDVTVKQARTGRGQSGIRVLITAGRVWARVVQVVGGRVGLTLESNEYAASAHDGLIGAEQGADGFVCWTRRGDLQLTDRGGLTNVVLAAGQRVWARFGWTAAPEPFLASMSVLEVRSTGPAMPLLRLPDGSGAAGFPASDVEVNQVFGSLTTGGGTKWLVEVPGGYTGPYTLILTGRATGPFKVNVSTRYGGRTTFKQEITGDIREGEQLITRITGDVKGPDPQTARVDKARVEELRAWDGAEPAVVVGSPDVTRGTSDN